MITVDIHDKVETVFKYFDDGGLLVGNNKVYQPVTLEQTFAKSFIKSGSKFSIMATGSSSSKVKPLRWHRYPDMSGYGGGDRWHPSTTNFDAV